MLCTTSFDGSIASTFKLTNQLTVCDNTREAALRSSGHVHKVKHTRNSCFSDMDAKVAFGLIEAEAEAFAQEVDTLCGLTVTDAQFDRFLSQLVPLPEVKERDINKRDYSTRNATIAARRRERLNELYRLDGRVSPWKGTAFGVLQMVNTYNTHEGTVGNMTDYDPTQEYALMAQAGLSPAQILASLTTAPAALWKEESRRGRLQEGLDADIVVLEADPMEDPRNFARVRCTLRAGEVIYRAR